MTCKDPKRVLISSSVCRTCLMSQCTDNPAEYQCVSGGCVPVYAVCDHIVHCEDKSDETVCHFPACSKKHEFQCVESKVCISRTMLCDFVEDCSDGSDEKGCPLNKCNGFFCEHENQCLPLSKKDNLVVDCSSGADEEELIKLTLQYPPLTNQASNCSVGHIPCHPDHSRCFPMAMACVYESDIFWTIKFCGNGAHLQHCEHMNCFERGLYKCHQSYCIYFTSLCNGIIDCPFGDDEHQCPILDCPPNFFKCKQQTLKCIHPSQVCDGTIHCTLQGEDEALCYNMSCPNECTCTAKTLKCYALNPMSTLFNYEEYLFSVRHASIHLSRPPSIRTILGHLKDTKLLNLSNNNVGDIKKLGKSFLEYYYLFVVDLSWNKLATLFPLYFSRLVHIQKIYLVGNYLKQLQYGELATSSGILLMVNLNNNSLVKIKSEAFGVPNNVHIGTLIITENDLNELPDLWLLSISRLVTSSEMVCCWYQKAPAICVVHGKDISPKCPPKMKLLSLLWVISIAMNFNAAAKGLALWRRSYSHAQIDPTHLMAIINLALCCFLFSLSLFELCIHYTVSTKIYPEWLFWLQRPHSKNCKLFGSFSFASCIISPLELTVWQMKVLMSLRSVVRKKALDLRLLLMNTTIWILILGVSLVPANDIGANYFCLPILVSGSSALGAIQYYALFSSFFALNSCIIVIINWKCVVTISKSRYNSGRTEKTKVEHFLLRD